MRSLPTAAVLAVLAVVVPAAAQPLPQQPVPTAPVTAEPLPPAGAPAPETAAPAPAGPVVAADLRIAWEVTNRFRLFRDERDFRRQAAAYQAGSVLAAEQKLAHDTDGRGWARDVLGNLCVDAAGRVTETCVRDGARESYLAPVDHRIAVGIAGPLEPGAACAWSFDDGQGPAQRFAGRCDEPVRLYVRYGRPTIAVADITGADGTVQRATTEILVRDLLIAGLGDSIAAGEGNPDRPVALANEGFCFRRVVGLAGEFYRPGRLGYRGSKACDGIRAAPADTAAWARLGARWLSNPCHRSLYGYQLRAALALAIEDPHAAVTFLPLACTGATIETLFDGQASRERACWNGASLTACPSTMPGQIGQLAEALAQARRTLPGRKLDLVFLTIGANDIDFSGLVADAIIEDSTERVVFDRGGVIGSVAQSQKALDGELPRGFARLRAALKPMVGGDLARVVYVAYGNPALAGAGTACPGGRDGFDVHPAFGLGVERIRRSAEFVERRFLPRLKEIATCAGGVPCKDPAADRMSFVDGHQQAFADHGLCARDVGDPTFDRMCFKAAGDSFVADPVTAPRDPLACSKPVREFQPYASRARWIRTANDSYFAAMTYPEDMPALLKPSDLHDANWGVLSALYGGAIHPTAEGHAAMADAALPAARGVLGRRAGEPQN